MSSPISVYQAIVALKSGVDALPTFEIEGEVSGWRGPTAKSGICYFKIKDDKASMDVIIWSNIYRSLVAQGIQISEGMQVRVTGTFNVYVAGGSVSFQIRTLAPSGEGLLRAKVRELAQRLSAEGLFDESKKRPILKFCERVAIVTSQSGEVREDVRRTLARRNPLVTLQYAFAQVQGVGAPESIIHALQVAAEAKPDVILLVRGGGSYEDLMTFNDEALVRAVAACPVPVVTGIGHEPDVTLCDFAADKRTSTPTHAAESVAPAISELQSVYNDRRRRLNNQFNRFCKDHDTDLEQKVQRLTINMGHTLERFEHVVTRFEERSVLRDPRFIYEDKLKELMLTEDRLHEALPRKLEREANALNVLGARLMGSLPKRLELEEKEFERTSGRFASIGTRLSVSYQKDVQGYKESLMRIGKGLLAPYEHVISDNASTLDALSPLKVLGRGYSITKDATGHIVSSVEDVSKEQAIQVNLRDGSLMATVTDITREQEHE